MTLENKTHSNIHRDILLTLIKTASDGDTITYSKLAQIHNLPEVGNTLGIALSGYLYTILLHCENYNMPPLTALVVRKSGQDRGLPGRGFWIAKNMNDLNRDEKRQKFQELLDDIYSVFHI